MPRYLRYLLLWLSCTAVSVTAVLLTVHFVVGSTRPKPLVARSAPTVFTSSTSRPPSPSAEPGPSRGKSTATPTPTASPSRAATTRKPSPRATPRPSRSTAPPPATSAPPSGPGAFTDCEGGAGVHTIESAGGQATVRFGDRGVCLVSAVPVRGFTVRTEQRERTTLTVTFSGQRRESEITATTTPQNKATIKETSW
ncbi:hypothetical protein DMH02_026885 [Streptomyces sp. WAC 00631]|uniref:hypothetical protein n=1 Tax=unclassified Streptomyces TaxID=2593676 RepID=UPI001E4A0467|nr:MULTISPECIES: hypothetical protein [unclassified Streptomyces]MCC5036698.1 hypothetical protein [Streptomyces sp. WAC 00631]MCC9738161.1 hypothetical protein [Streptomyces sp. MNU89]